MNEVKLDSRTGDRFFFEFRLYIGKHFHVGFRRLEFLINFHINIIAMVDRFTLKFTRRLCNRREMNIELFHFRVRHSERFCSR